MSILIQSMTEPASLELLARATLGRFACANEGRPYITPMSVTYDAHALYGFSTVGQKITWMRANPHVCVEVEEIVSRLNWATVIVMGRYRELTSEADRSHAHGLLERRPSWWEPGYSKTVIGGKERRAKGVYFRISIEEVTGHIGIPD